MKNNKVEQIMRDYKREIRKIDDKYEVKNVKKIDTKEIDEKIEYEKSFIEKLETQGKDENTELIGRAKERLEKAEKEKQEIQDKYEEAKTKREEKLNNVMNLKNSKVILPSGREVTQKEKDEMDKNDLKDKAIRELTQESNRISKELINKQKELEAKVEEKNNFKYEFEKDENGKSTGKSINDNVIDKIYKDYENIKKEMLELNKMQEACNKYLEEFKQKDNEKMKKFSKAWNESNKKENNQQVKTETKEQPQVENQTKEQPQEKTETKPQEQTEVKNDVQVQRKTQENRGLNEIILDIHRNKINVNGNEDLFYKEETKNKEKIINEYGINSIFLNDKKSKRNLDYALISALEKIDKSLVETYLKVIKDGKLNNNNVKENIEKLNESVDIKYKFNEETNIFRNLKEKRLARNAKKLGIASLEGISEKSIFDIIKEKFAEIKNTKLLSGIKNQKALGSGEKINAQEQKIKAIDLINKDREQLGIKNRIKVENQNNEIERKARETEVQIGKEVQDIQNQEEK